MFLPQAGPLGTLLGFAIGGFLISFVAIAYSYMIKYAPVAGGSFAWAYIGFGPTAAFICGWAIIIGYIAIIAINISALALICRFLLPGFLEFGELYTIAGWKVYAGEVILMSIAVLLFGIMNYRGIGFAGKIQVVLAFMLTFGTLALFSGASALDTTHITNLAPVFAEGKTAFSCVLTIFAISPFLYVGFDTVPQSAEEFAFDPSRARNIMFISIFAGMILYSLVMLSTGLVIPYPEMLSKMAEQRASGGTAWATAEAAVMAFGKFGAVVLACAVLGAVCTGINGFYVAATRLLFAMARSHMLPAWFGEIHPKYKTPYKAILFTIFVVLLTPYAGRSAVAWTVDMSAVGTSIGYLFTCLAARRMLIGTNAEGKGLKTFYCNVGALTSILCLLLLWIPGSPGAIGTAPSWCLAVWIVLGVFFYYSSRSAWKDQPELELRQSLLGRKDMQVFYTPAQPGKENKPA